MVDDKELIEQLKEENLKKEDLLKKEEALLERQKAERLLSGKSLQGAESRLKRKLTDVEYAKAFMQGKVKLTEPEPEVDA